MSLRAKSRSGAAPPSPRHRAAQGRMSSYDLLFLAAGGVIGSGWLLAGTRVDSSAGSWALGSWLIGGLLVLVVTAVMVEVSTRVPKTGGLIFLPLQTSGPLLATVVAAGVWVFYAANPASESIAMVQGVAAWGHWPGLFDTARQEPTWPGIGLAAGFLLLITVVNLLRPRRFLTVNNLLTAFKIFVPLLIVILLVLALARTPAHPVRFPPAAPPAPAVPPTPPTQSPGTPGAGSLSSALSAVIGSGVIYAYLGFQGPLDFAGNVRGGGIGEAGRLRRAVYGTVLGSILLYTALQCVIIYLKYHSTGSLDGAPSVYPEFAGAAVGPGWPASVVTWLINLDSVLSPAGTAMVFTYVLTREVAALSRAHLTHRGLQRRQNSVTLLPAGLPRKVLGGDRLDAYRWILIVDFVISLIMLLVTGGHWTVLQYFSAITALVVYSTPSVVLAALRLREPSLFPQRRYALMAQASFAALAVVLVLATQGVLWGMGALAVGCLLLFWLPVAAPMAPWYDARAHVREFGQLRTSDAAKLATVLGGYFLVLTLEETVRRAWPSRAGAGWDGVGLALIVATSVLAFRWLVRLSAAYMVANPPLLPPPLPKPPQKALSKALSKALRKAPPGPAGRGQAGGTVTGGPVTGTGSGPPPTP